MDSGGSSNVVHVYHEGMEGLPVEGRQHLLVGRALVPQQQLSAEVRKLLLTIGIFFTIFTNLSNILVILKKSQQATICAPSTNLLDIIFHICG